MQQPEIHALIMDAIANDYESLDMILRQVDQWCAAGASPSKAEVIEGLEALVDKELAGAYRLSASGSPEIVHEFRSAGVADDLYFLLTAKGKAALSCEATPDSPS